MGGKSGEEKNSDVIVEYRLKNGLCHGCGARIYDISNGRVSPLTIKGVVREGRCLFCYPDTGAEEKKDTPKDKGKRKVDKTLSSSDKTKPFRGRLRSDPEQPPAAPAIKKEIVEDGSNQKHSPAAPAIKEKNVPATPAIKKEILDDVSSSGRDISTDTSVARLPQRPIPSKEEEEEEDSSDDEQVKIKMHNINRKSSSSRDVSIADIDGNIYHGTVTKGNTQKGSGLFRFVYSKGPFEGKDSTYEGEFENGLMEGHGTSRDAVCCVYTGEYHKGAAHGNGNCTWAGNWKYEGEWKMDEREGHGKLWQDVKNGEVYEGEWKDDQWNGLGELKFSVGGRYIGEFKNHHLDGQGRYEFRDGSVYEGSFKNEHRVGYGVMTYAEGVRYEGEWKHNWREGKGSLYYTDGSVFKGTFRGDEKISGVLTLPDGIMRRERYVAGVLQH